MTEEIQGLFISVPLLTVGDRIVGFMKGHHYELWPDIFGPSKPGIEKSMDEKDQVDTEAL